MSDYFIKLVLFVVPAVFVSFSSSLRAAEAVGKNGVFPARVCALMESRDKSVRKAGFINDKTGANFVLAEGRAVYGYEIVKIDLLNETVTVSRRGAAEVLLLSGSDKVHKNDKLRSVAGGAGVADLKKLKDSKAGKLMGSGSVLKTAAPPPGFKLLVSKQ